MRSTSRGFAGALAACLLFAACDDEGGTGPGEDVYGVWQLADGESAYLHVQTETVTLYRGSEVLDCYDAFTYEVVDREGDVFTLDDGQGEIVTTIRREGDGLVVEMDTEEATYRWVDDELPDITEC